ncbi:peptidyl-prolyl cis-trans isomerase [Daeguia caeni]|uniref:Parvulin-like PPIase n=1 Tax=Daeguia caeni TaxID=439612 RepID=A0ABV9H5P6_9HYPH
MLESLRSAAQSWIAKILLGILILSFTVWGIADVFRGGINGNAILIAGGSEVSPDDFRFAYEQQLSRLSQQFRQRLTREQAKAIGLDNQVLSELAAGVVLDEQARNMQLGLSKDGIARLTAEDPAFHDASGRFNRQLFNVVLRQAGIRPDDYLENRAKVARRQQIVEAATDGLKMPATMLKALALYQGESRNVDFLTVPVEKPDAIPNPSDDVLKTYFDEHKDEYKAPEYRKFTYVKLEPSDIADPAAITQEEIQAYYDKNKDRYGTPEKRTIEQINFTDMASAKAALDRIKAGTGFEDIGKEQGKTGDDLKLGTFEKSALPDSAIAEAAFALPLNGVSDVVEGAFGPVLLRVTAIEPGHTKTLADVSDEIRNTLATNQALNDLSGVHDAYEQDRSEGNSMADTARKLNLKTVTIEAVDAEGNDPSGKPVDLPNTQALLPAVFQADQGFDNDALTLGNNGYLWYQVDDITPAHDRTLDEVTDKVIAAWKEEEAARRLTARMEELKKRVDGGTTLDALASELGLEKQTRMGVTRATNDASIGSAAAAQIFRGPDGLVGIAPAPAGNAQILFKVTSVTEPAGAGADSIPEAQRNYLARAVSDDVLEQLVGELQKQYPVRVNQDLLNRVLAF